MKKKRYFENNKKTLEEGELLINQANDNPLTMDNYNSTKKQRFEIPSETQNLKKDTSLSIDTFINETLSSINSSSSTLSSDDTPTNEITPRPSSSRSSSSTYDSSKKEISTIVNNSRTERLLNEPRFDINFKKDSVEASKNLKITYCIDGKLKFSENCIDGKLKFSENSGEEIGFLKNSQLIIPINSKIRKIIIVKND